MLIITEQTDTVLQKMFARNILVKVGENCLTWHSDFVQFSSKIIDSMKSKGIRKVDLELLINQILSQYLKNVDIKDLNNFVIVCMARYELFSKRMDVLP